MPDLPSGTVTFLFTDIEGSTRLWQEHPDAMPVALARHHAILRDAIESRQGSVFQVIGDAFCAAFATAPDALAAALEIQRGLLAAAESPQMPVPLRVRIGVHSGAAEARDGAYLSSPTLIRVQRVMAAGHGGQTLLSDAAETLARDVLPPDVRLQDMGRHRLKGLVRPEHIFQVNAPGLPDQFPPLVTLDVFPNNLPTPLNTFIGREREIGEIKRLLLTHDARDATDAGELPHRLVTLTGVGGTGKTRLALQVAAEALEAFPHGVWLAELAPIADAGLVPQAVASVLNVREEPGLTLLDALIDHLRTKHLLLVLDNCEHLVEACARLTETLLRFCPRLVILATSREAIGIGGERTWFVPTLSQPDPNQSSAANAASAEADLPAQLLHFEAVRLFVDRARAAHPPFALTVQNAAAVTTLCRHLDGIPLAIELAAARLRALSLEQIVARLDDRFNLLTVGSRTALPRQQTLRATIDWSYDLLSEDERTLFRRLSVFAGGWALEAAEFVCGTPVSPAVPVLDLLSQLVNKSLVVMDVHDSETHYHMLETIRQYARGRLEESGEAPAVERRHRDFYLRLAEQAEPYLRTADQLHWLNRLDTDHDNLYVAMDWSLEQEEPLEALSLAGSLRCFFYLRDYWTQGREWLQRTLSASAAPPAGESDAARTVPERDQIAARAKALAALGWLANDSGEEKEPYEQSLALCRRIDDRRGTAFALRGLGVAAYNTGDYRRATELLDESLSLYESLDDVWGTGLVRLNQGWLAFEQDDRPAAQALWEHSLAWFQRSSDRWGIAVVLGTLSYAARLRGDNLKAMLLAQESLTLFRELGDKSGISNSLLRLGMVAYRHENLKQTTDLLQESLALQRKYGYERSVADSLVVLGHVACLQGEYVRAGALLEEGLALAKSLSYAGGEARALGMLGTWAFHQERFDRAGAYLEESVKRFEEAGDAGGTASSLAGLGRLALARGDHATAERLLQRSLELSRRGGDKSQIAAILDNLGAAARAQGALPRASELAAKALAMRKEANARRSVAESLESVAAIARLRDQPERAVRLWAAAAALRADLGSPHAPVEKTAFDAETANLRVRLGDGAYDAAWTAGRALALEQAVTLALGEAEQST